ncbi:unnamed protein product [Lactuca saligna]|uniref:Uncharacterized protein n=1 Tax=Lactuca saligna TaxID=75948 RepID=A0AA35ZST4_LACSI|nr:unnamed protein product [Lactuca saligna]
MSKTNSEKIAGLEAGVAALEQDLTKLREEANLAKKENAAQFTEVLQAINNLMKTVKGKLIQEEEKDKEDPEFELEFGSFKKGPKDDKNKAANLARAMTLAVMIDENKFSIGTPKTSGGVIRSNNSGSSRPGGAFTNMGCIII